MLQEIFNYNGNQITFVKNGNVFVNATEMAKPFEKVPGKWLELPSSKEFLKELYSIRKSDSLIKTAEGRNGGTWMHEDVALEFARWLSPAFAIWCNDHIKQMLKTGQTSLGSLEEDKTILEAMKILQQRVETTTKQLELANHTIKHQAPKVNYYDQVLDSQALISTTIIAKDLGMSAEELNRRLNQRGIIFRSGKSWVPYSAYQNKGYCKSKTYPYIDQSGSQQTAHHFYWTETGRLFIMEQFQREYQKAQTN